MLSAKNKLMTIYTCSHKNIDSFIFSESKSESLLSVHCVSQKQEILKGGTIVKKNVNGLLETKSKYRNISIFTYRY